MAPAGKNKNPHGLGRAIINQKAKDARHSRESNLYTTDLDNSSRLKSITQEPDLDAFLNTAQLAATDFTAERHNIKIIQPVHNPFLLSTQEERDVLRRHRENKEKLRVPRRPPWTRELTSAQLERQERDAFLDWRRSLAELEEEKDLLLTPFERNIEVWRQLWRVLERSHLVVQIVDARNPLRFRCEDLESYVRDIEGIEGESGTAKDDFRRRNLLLINKADLLTRDQREQWANYFDEQGVTYAFFSAADAAALQATSSEVQEELSEEEGYGDGTRRPLHEEGGNSESDAEAYSDDSHVSDDADDTIYFSADEGAEDRGEDDRARVLSVNELEDLFICSAPKPPQSDRPTTLTIGLVGYPNVGKSSTINALLGKKQVSVSATPGKTKHFQTMYLRPDLILCDCPGLVFPQFATQKADLVCDGVLPIDQLREYRGPVGLVTKRIGREVLEGTYGLTIRRGGEETGIQSDEASAEDLLVAYAIARGFARSGQGNPDESRAARYILKDYVNAKLLFCHPPPGVSDDLFNTQTHENAIRRLREAGKKKLPVTRVGKGANTFVSLDEADPARPAETQSSRAVDAAFFGGGPGLTPAAFVQGQKFTRARIYPHQNMVADDGTEIGGRRARMLAVIANNPDVAVGKKKHHKGNKRAKQRSGKGYDGM